MRVCSGLCVSICALVEFMAVFGLPQVFRVFSVLFLSLLAVMPAGARDFELAAGEAFVTRFSGTVTVRDEAGQKTTIVNRDGLVGSVFDLRFPGHKPRGQHWRDEPQSFPVYARQTGQVFGIAFDNEAQPNIYLTATSAYGLYRTKSNDGWMAGMWGKGGGPGTVYKLNAKNDYQPQVFAHIRLNGRDNAGAALGNIAFDAKNRQLFVSDLETGMIHRLDVKTGRDLGHYDHGGVGRGYFYDAALGHDGSLPLVFFQRESRAKCRDKATEKLRTPDCWRYTHPARRVWGLGVRQTRQGDVRVFYAIWDRSARSQIWSVGLNDKGGFDLQSVRREFIVPAADVNLKNAMPAISDIAFSGDGRMLLAERGAPRQTRIVRAKPVASVSQARVLQYRQLEYGAWVLEGVYGVGNYNSAQNGQPARFYNAAGGVSWGFGRNDTGAVNLASRAGFVWATGDGLCSPSGPCLNGRGDAMDDTDFVTGIEGRAASLWAGNLTASFKIDSDINVDGSGRVIAREARRNDDSRGGGDVEVFGGDGAKPAVPGNESVQAEPVPDPDPVMQVPEKTDVRALVLPRRKPMLKSNMRRLNKKRRLAKKRIIRRKKSRRVRKVRKHRKAIRRPVVMVYSGDGAVQRVIVSPRKRHIRIYVPRP